MTPTRTISRIDLLGASVPAETTGSCNRLEQKLHHVRTSDHLSGRPTDSSDSLTSVAYRRRGDRGSRTVDNPGGQEFVEPEVHSFPSNDAQFRAVVDKTIELYAPTTPDGLAELIRPAYRFVDVVVRNAAEFANGARRIWYVFRDGEGVPDDAEM
jgi:hypothetical protein